MSTELGHDVRVKGERWVIFGTFESCRVLRLSRLGLHNGVARRGETMRGADAVLFAKVMLKYSAHLYGAFVESCDNDVRGRSYWFTYQAACTYFP